MVSYYFVNDLKDINSTNFEFETRIKSDSLVNINCPHIGIIIYGVDHMMFIPLIAKGCEELVSVQVGTIVKNGENNDFSAFGVDLYSWQILNYFSLI